MPRTIPLSETGNHHSSELLYNPKAKKITSGFVLNYGENTSCHFDINNRGKVSGELCHTGGTHFLNMKLNEGGSFTGRYYDTNHQVELAIEGKNVRVKKGTIDSLGIRVNGKHHKTSLRLAKGRLNGYMAGTNTKYGSFKVQIKDGKIAGGVYQHKGRKHNSSVSFDGKNWKAKVSTGIGKSRLSFSVKGGAAKAVMKGRLGVEF